MHGIYGAVDGYSEETQKGMEFAESFEDWNGLQRDALNEEYFSVHTGDPTKNPELSACSPKDSAFHQTPGFDVVKLQKTQPDRHGGYPEIVYNKTINQIDTNPKTRGTYNYGEGASHGPLDVAPWVLLGTGRDDPTSMGDRLMSLIIAAPAKIEATAKKSFNWE